MVSLFSFWIFFPVSRFTSLELNWSYKRNEIHGFNFTRLQSLYSPSNKITYSIHNHHISNSRVSRAFMFSFHSNGG